MNIIINHNQEIIETSQQTITVAELLKVKMFTYKMLIVKVNDTLILKDNYSTTNVQEGDNVMVIHLMTGG